MRSYITLLRLSVLAALLLAALLITAACNGDDDGSGSEETPDATTPASGTLAPTAPPDATAFEQLAALNAAGVDKHVVYAVDSENFGTHPTGTWTAYRLGSNVREDWVTVNFGYEETNIAIVRDGRFYFCNATPFQETCREQASIEDLDLVLLLFTPVKDVPAALLTENLDYTATELPPEEIAGLPAQCFDVNVSDRIGPGAAGTERMKMCFGEDGALLSMDRRVTFADGQPDAWITTIAQEAGDVQESDFEPPVEPGPILD